MVSRRGLIELAGIGATLAITGARFPDAFPALSTARRASSSSQDRLILANCFSESWSEAVEVPFPAELNLEKLRRGARVTIEWDSRLFSVDDVFELAADGSLNASEARVTPSRIDVTPRPEAVGLISTVRTRTLYPNDNLSGIRETRAALGEQTVTFRSKRRAASPWGAEIQASWLQLPGGVSTDLVVIKSVGPSAIPAGVGLIISQAPGNRGEWESTTGARARSRRSGASDYVLEYPLRPRESLEVSFQNESTSDDVLDGRGEPGIVSLTAPIGSWRDARDTGAYQCASVTDSGTPLALETVGRP